MDKSTLVTTISLGSLLIFAISFGFMLKGCDGTLRAYCVDKRMLAVACAATLASVAGLITTIIGWHGLPTWLHIAGIGIPILIVGVWIKETIFSL